MRIKFVSLIAIVGASSAWAWNPVPVHQDQNVFMPGTQPANRSFAQVSACNSCHGDYDAAVEPTRLWQGSMMGQAARDPLWLACMAVAEQDSIWALGNPNAGDLCLRCHTPTGWLSGRSDPPNGTALDASKDDFEGVSCELCHRMVDPFNGLRQMPTLPAETNAAAIAQAEATYAADFSILTNVTLFDGSPFLDPQTRLPAHYGSGAITNYSEAASGQFFIDPGNQKRGPRPDSPAFHQWGYSRFHKTPQACGACHDVSNPVLANAVGGAGTSEKQAAGSYFHVERTWSEFMLSGYGRVGGASTKPAFADAGIDWADSCQDCHMPAVQGKSTGWSTPVYPDLRSHDLTGGNAWLTAILASLDKTSPAFNTNNYNLLSGTNYPGARIDVAGLQGKGAALQAAQQRIHHNLRRAATLELVSEEPTNLVLRVQNNTGHKLISGFPEGRRMWLNLEFRDAAGHLVEEVNPYAPLVVSTNGQGRMTYVSGATLRVDRDDLVYEAKLTSSLTDEGTTFHFVLATGRHKDNRIPPKLFDIARAPDRLVQPCWKGREAPDYFTAAEYAGGYDEISIAKPATAAHWRARLFYQTTSKEYLEFLRDEIDGTGGTLSSPTPSGEAQAYILQSDPYFASLADWGQALWEMWVSNGGSAPFEMTSLSSPPRIAAATVEGDAFKTMFQTTPGATYRLYGTGNLTNPVWTTVGEAVPGDGALHEILDPILATNVQRFYRLQMQQP